MGQAYRQFAHDTALLIMHEPDEQLSKSELQSGLLHTLWAATAYYDQRPFVVQGLQTTLDNCTKLQRLRQVLDGLYRLLHCYSEELEDRIAVDFGEGN